MKNEMFNKNTIPSHINYYTHLPVSKAMDMSKKHSCLVPYDIITTLRPNASTCCIDFPGRYFTIKSYSSSIKAHLTICAVAEERPV